MFDYQIQSGDSGRVLNIDCSKEPIAVILPAPSAGFNITIKDAYGHAALNNITIKRNSSSDQIDGEVNDDIIVIPFAAISYISDGTGWYRASGFNGGIPNRGLIAGGYDGSVNRSTVEYIHFSGKNSAKNFGNLTVARRLPAGFASTTRGMFAGGGDPNAVNVIDYIEFATGGEGEDFGDLTVSRGADPGAPAGCSSSTRGITAGGGPTAATYSNVIDYVTIASKGNAIDFGDLTSARSRLAGCSSPTRGVFGGGWSGQGSGQGVNTIDYITIATTGNATSFGTLTQARQRLASASSSTRGLFHGGVHSGFQNVIDYITIATTGNATDFGDLAIVRQEQSASTDSILAVFAGGQPASGFSDHMEYVTIATLGNAQDFGNLQGPRTATAGCSNAHGGLNG